MADLPPDFQIPVPKPARPQRPIGISLAAWILVAAGGITALGGLLIIGVGGDSATGAGGAFGLAFIALGVAELITGVELLRMRALFRLVGAALAIAGIVVDIAGLVGGSKWQVFAVLGHGIVAYVLLTSAETFRSEDRG